MTAWQLLAPVPFLTLDAGCTITVEAINPTTGAAVTGVTVSQVAIYGTNDALTADPVPQSEPLTWVSIADDPPE